MTSSPRKKPDPRRTLDAMPSGEPLYKIARDILQAVGKWQVRNLREFARIKAVDPLDPLMAAQNMTARFIPYIEAYIDQGANHVFTEMSLQPADDWAIRNPYALQAARNAAYDLCQETIDSFLIAGADQVDQLRAEAARSIAAGEPAGDLVDRMARWFEEDARWRARRIAVTESARAFNIGQVTSTQDLDFVAGYKWVLSDDACPLCHTVARMCPVVPKGGVFAQNGKNETYKNIKFPPLHPNCRCTLVVVFDDEIPDSWPQTVLPDPMTSYIKPSENDIMSAREGGYQSVGIGNAKSVTGFVAIWGE